MSGKYLPVPESDICITGSALKNQLLKAPVETNNSDYPLTPLSPPPSPFRWTYKKHFYIPAHVYGLSHTRLQGEIPAAISFPEAG